MTFLRACSYDAIVARGCRSAIQAPKYLIWWSRELSGKSRLKMNGHRRSGKPSPAATDAKRSKRHPVFGALKDFAFVPPGVDLTEPADSRLGQSLQERSRRPGRQA